MVDVQGKLGQSWNAYDSFNAAMDCQRKRIEGESPQDYNDRNFYPNISRLDAFTDVSGIGIYNNDSSLWFRIYESVDFHYIHLS
jgi:hypothetical protein